MNPTLVICLLLAVATALAAATLAVLAGWGWLAGFGVYVATGSVSLVTAVVAAEHRALTRTAVRPAVDKTPAYA